MTLLMAQVGNDSTCVIVILYILFIDFNSQEMFNTVHISLFFIQFFALSFKL